MACTYSPADIEQLVVLAYREILEDKTITRFSRFGPGKEIDIDPDARRAFYFPLKQRIDRPPDCVIAKLQPGDVQNARTVGDIVDAICTEFEISNA